jgi:hypothetical protein
MYTVFTRTWWKTVNGKLTPHVGRKTILARNVSTQEEARRICEQYNSTHNPGKLSRRAEYSS